MTASPNDPEAESPSRLSSLQTTAMARRIELPTRLAVALVGACVVAYACGAALAGAWAASVLVTQALSMIVNRRFCDADDARPPTTVEWVSSVAVMFVGGVAYSTIAPILWFGWGEAGQVFAMVWLCGALMHIALHMHHDRPLYIAGTASHLVYFAGLPLYALVTDSQPGRIGAAVMLLAVALYMGHCLVAFRRQAAASASLRAARERAVERQAAAEEANRIKGQFLAMMSHELRTPMNGVLGMARLLMNSGLTPKQKEQVLALHDAGDMLMSILNDVLDISKIEANRIELEDGDIAVRQLTAGLFSLWRGRAEEKGLTLSVAIAPNTPCVIAGDPVRVRQILFNLISNAVKFTDEGRVEITVGAVETRPGRALFRFEVADTGCGIAPEDVERLFVAFEQADRTTTRRFGGTGLGLAISRELARLMGGDIRVASAEGVGSRFEFAAEFSVVDARPCPSLDVFEAVEPDVAPAPAELVAPVEAPAPLAPPAPDDTRYVDADDELEFEDVTGCAPLEIDVAAPADAADETTETETHAAVEPSVAAAPEPAAPRDRRPAPAPEVGARISILCAEDQELNRRVIAAMLDRVSCDLTFAFDGGDAVARLEERRFDLIFMDLQMPVHDGIDVTRRVREGSGPNARTPIIGLTANVLPGVREACLEAGMDDFVGKPIDLARLYQAMERVFARRAEAEPTAGAA